MTPEQFERWYPESVPHTLRRRTSWQRVKKWFWDLVRGPQDRPQFRDDLRTREYRLGRQLRNIAFNARPWPTHKVSPERYAELTEQPE